MLKTVVGHATKASITLWQLLQLAQPIIFYKKFIWMEN